MLHFLKSDNNNNKIIEKIIKRKEFFKDLYLLYCFNFNKEKKNSKELILIYINIILFIETQLEN